MIRFFNGRVLRPGKPFTVTEDEVWITDDVITYVGPKKEEMPAFDRQIDLKGDLLIPGLKNAHAHSAMTFLRSFADDMNLQDWLFNRVFPMEGKLTPELVYVFTQIANMEYVAGGITASYDMYFEKDSCAQANIDMGFRSVFCCSTAKHDKDPWKMEREYLHLNGLHPLISLHMGLHAEYTINDEIVAYAREMSEKYGASISAHCAETASEVAECIQRHGVTPVRYFEENGLMEHGGAMFHCVYVTPEDMEILKRHGIWAVTCPCSNLKLASGVAPIVEMQKAGVPLAIGTDGPASNNGLDMFREMYLVSVLQKMTRKDAAACDADSVLDMALTGGAKAMGLHNCVSIDPGMQADLAVIDMNRPSMQPVHNITKNLVYSGGRDCVRMTMVAGKVLYENGEFPTIGDPRKLYERASKLLKEICTD